MSDNHGSLYTIHTNTDTVDWNASLKSVQSDKFLSLLLSMVPLVSHKGQEDRLKKINGLSPTGHGFNLRADQHLEYHHFSEPNYLGNGSHCSNICSTSYDYDPYDYCDGRDVSETDAMLQDSRNPGDGDSDALLEGNKKLPKESSFTMALQILVPFLLAGFGTVSAGMVLDIVQHWEVFKNLTEVFILVPALLGLKGNLEMTLASRLSTAVNVGKMDSPIEKWNLIIGNLALKQVQATVVGFLAAVAAVILGWIPEGKYRLDHAILLCSSSVATAFIASLLQGIIMVGVIVGSKKTGINPDNVATPIAASFGDLITLAILAWISQGLYSCIGIGGNLVAIQASRISTDLHLHSIPGELPDEDTGCFHPFRTFYGTGVNKKSSQVLLSLVIPGHLIFLYTIYLMKSGHTSLTPIFIMVYLLAALLQVFALLWIADWMVHHIWRKGKDPDSFSIPYLTALGDLLGTALLAISFHILWLIGDRDGDVGD
ncbi:solute carrier family 41 member 2 isoform X2 [Hyla sarda]|uniref:solute carrier family 41 member 2 isoform X2 n=1 Tax=Hyla sarda TaxID=327740 RepID=UPI0024C3E6FC|nr:solute carrier family 41 member 2 isoform X2 [Hyla sarda]